MKRTEALFILTGLLSSAPHDVAAMTRSDWEAVMAIANRELLVPALYVALRSNDQLVHIADHPTAAFMQTVYEANRARNEAIVLQIQEICDLLHPIGVSPVLLKGAAALSESHFDDIGVRVMMDIDLLVPETKIFACLELLVADGYRELNTQATRKPDWHHYNRMQKAGHPASLELHRRALNSATQRFLSDDTLYQHLLPSHTIRHAKVIAPAYEMFHAFLHAELSHSYHRNRHLGLRHLHHFYMLVLRSGVDQQILPLLQSGGLERIWNDYLYMLHRLFPVTPPGLHADARAKRHFHAVLYRIEHAGTMEFRLRSAAKLFFKSFSYDKISRQYASRNVMFYPFLIILHLFRLAGNLIFSAT